MPQGDGTNQSSSATEREPPVSRRTVLRGLAATGLAGGFAGCVDTVNQKFEATPVEFDESRATFLGYEPDPLTETTRVDSEDGTASNALSPISLTSHTRTWRYQSGFGGDSGDDDGPGSWILPDCDNDIVDGDDPGGLGPVRPSLGGQTGPVGTLGPTDDRLAVRSLPDPGVGDLRLNPAARASLVELAESHTEEFEQLCDCNIGDAESIEVRTATTDDKLRAEDVGSVVYVIEDLEALGVSNTVRLLDDERELSAFAFATESESGGLVGSLVLAAKAGYTPNGGGRDVAIAGYVARERRPAIDRPRPLVGEGGLFAPVQVDAYFDRFAVACPCLGPTNGPDQERGGPPTTTTPESAGDTTEIPVKLDPEALTAERTQQFWERARSTDETRTVEAVANDSFGLSIDDSDLAAYRATNEGMGSYVLRAPLTGRDGQSRDTIYVAYFDEREDFQMAGITITRVESDAHLLIQSFAPVGEERQDHYATIRTGRVASLKRRTGATETDLVAAVQQDRATTATVRGDDDDPYWVDVLEKIGCRFCDVGISVIEGIITDMGCTVAGYTVATGSLGSVSGNPAGASGGFVLMKAVCKQLMSKASDWLIDTADCCLCFELGLCERTHCENLYEDGLMSQCGCCPCDDDDDSTGSGSGGVSGGTGTSW